MNFIGFYGNIENPRKERGKKQNIFLIERLPKIKNFHRNFIVMGSSGNVYEVKINDKPSCTCPDHTSRNNRCKHIYFVLIRIMHVKKGDEDKDIYTKQNLKKMFKSIPKITNNLLINKQFKDRYDSQKRVVNGMKVEQKSTDDLCPICLDDLETEKQ